MKGTSNVNRTNVSSVLLLLLTLLLASGVLFTSCGHIHVYEDTVILPTCTSVGYTIHTCACGDVYYSDYKAKTAHEYAEWTTAREADAIYGGEETSVCVHCGKLLIRETSNVSGLTRVLITRGSRDESMTLEYIGASHRFSCLVSLSQATAETDKPDLYLTLTDENDAAYSIDLGWGPRNVYHLSAYTVDPTKLREQECIHFWELLRKQSDANPAIYLYDGAIPIQLYEDGVYRGLYFLAPPAGYGADEGGKRSVLVQHGTAAGCMFKEEPVRYDGTNSGFSFLNITDERAEQAWASFQEFHAFVRTAEDADFTRHLKNYADVDELIDFYLFSQVFFAAGAGEENILWLTEDGVHWKADFRTLECSIGKNSEGSTVYNGLRLPVRKPEGLSAVSNHYLWTRILACFPKTVVERYRALRELITLESALSYFRSMYDAIPSELYSADAELYPSVPYPPDTEAVEQFLTVRFTELDDRILSEPEPDEPQESQEN